jgi:hypothetical protein
LRDGRPGRKETQNSGRQDKESNDPSFVHADLPGKETTILRSLKSVIINSAAKLADTDSFTKNNRPPFLAACCFLDCPND